MERIYKRMCKGGGGGKFALLRRDAARLVRTAAALGFAALCPSCADDLAVDGEGAFGEECALSMDVGFTGFGAALDTRTRAAQGGVDGDAIKEIETMQVLFYANSGGTWNLKYIFKSSGTVADAGVGSPTEDGADGIGSGTFTFQRSDEDRQQGDNSTQLPNGGNVPLDENTTRHASFMLNGIRRGNYRIYVVANMPEGFDARKDAPDDVRLRDYKLAWNTDNITANNAMFGYFTTDDVREPEVIRKDAPTLTINGSASLHAWIKRAVSKVTVAFDGTRLEPDVRIYIKSVQLHDIPMYCSLGRTNSPEHVDSLCQRPDENGGGQPEEASQSKVVYSTVEKVDNDNVIFRESPYYPDFNGNPENEDQVREWRNTVHAAEARSLYFYENCQGLGARDAVNDADGSYKPQTDGNGNAFPDDYDNNYDKDSKTYGSYVEVKAYYENDNLARRTEGNIVYRFMLGKDVINDFDAERSIHYKLTLVFNGHANDVDWHIDYNDEPGDHTPDTIYVSYSYNTPSILPFQFVGEAEVKNLKATITANHWTPDNDGVEHYDQAVTPEGLSTGFLSLRFDPNVRISENDKPSAGENVENVKSYWEKNPSNQTQTYIVNGEKNPSLDSDLNDNSELIKEEYKFGVSSRQNSDGNYVTSVNIPLYTRPLMIYKNTSWTGANPFYTSTRSATVRLEYTLEDGSTFTKDVHVEQVDRINNPSGIWRRADNDERFEVTLMNMTGPESYFGHEGQPGIGRGYAPYVSHGAWRAYVYISTGTNGSEEPWFTLTSGGQTADAVGEYIQGMNGTNISFTYKPNGTIERGQSRCGVIKVEYNDYTCTHYILVRQGYAPLQISSQPNAPLWHTFNLINQAEETVHPCDAGSLFVYGSFSPAVVDDQSPDGQGLNHANNVFGTKVENLRAYNNGSTTIGTYNIASNQNNDGKTRSFPETNLSLSSGDDEYNSWNTGVMPTYENFQTMLDDANSDVTIDKEFGILYADGATTTQSDYNTATGCLHSDIVDGETDHGMRGAFAYNSKNGRQVFFPIGASGFGRRKITGELQYGGGVNYTSGVLPSNLAARPLLRELYYNEGAIYWMRAWHASTSSMHANGENGWDINYKTYDFDFMDAGENTTSLSYIRLVNP